MNQPFWKFLRIAEIGVFLVVILTSGCFLDDCSPDTVGTQTQIFSWEGETWRLYYYYVNTTNVFPLWIENSRGQKLPINDPRLPFTMKTKDGDIEIGPRPSTGGAAKDSPKRHAVELSGPPYYAYILSDNPEDVVYIFDQQTRMVVQKITLPTRPQGIAVNNSGTRAYVTNQGIEQGNPFFPQAPPRLRVIDKATRSISRTIDLTPGMNPGKPVVSPDDLFVYVPYSPDTRQASNAVAGVAVVNADSGALAQAIPLSVPTATVTRIAMTPDGALLFAIATQSIPARVFVIDTFTREQVATFVVANSSIRDALLDYTGSRLYLLNQNSLVVYDTATLTESGRLAFASTKKMNSMALSIDGNSIFISDEFTGAVTRVKRSTFQIAEEIPPPGPAPDSSMVFSVPSRQ